MLRCTSARGESVRITFAVPTSEVDQPVSVLGNFNGWDPTAHPLKKRSNGTRSATIEAAPGQVLQFKYLTADGTWFCDPDVDTVTNAFHTADSLFVV